MTAVTPAPTTWPAGPAPSVRLSGVSKRHGDAISGVVALQDISLDVAPGEFVCLVGASGCGKTTLLNLVAGLDRPSVGTVAVATSTVPTLGRSRPATRLSRVVFPHPEAPTRQTNSPGATSREMSWRATTPEIASMSDVGNPAALAWTRSARMDEAMGSLVKVMFDHAVATSPALSGLPVK